MQALNTIFQAIDSSVLTDPIQSLFGSINTHYLTGPSGSGLNTPATHITKHIQYPLAWRQALQQGTVFAVPCFVVAFMLLNAFEYTRNEVSASTVGLGSDYWHC